MGFNAIGKQHLVCLSVSAGHNLPHRREPIPPRPGNRRIRIGRGYNTEYSGMKFWRMFYAGELLYAFFFYLRRLLVHPLFFGGYRFLAG